MTPDRWNRVKEMFERALDRAPGERTAFVGELCGEDDSLRSEVISLLAAHEKEGSFIDSPAYHAAAEVLADGHQLNAGLEVGHYRIAFVGLADCNAVLPFYSKTISDEALPQAKAYAERAIEIDDSLGEAHTSLGYADLCLWNWAEAEKELKRGIELNPNYATAHKFYGNYLSDQGRFAEALAEFKRAQELEPLSLIMSANIAEVYLTQGNLNGASEQCQRAIGLDPNWYYVRQLLSLVYLKQGRSADALAEAEHGLELSKRHSTMLGVLGYIYAQTGKRNEATKIIEELKTRQANRQAYGLELARIYLGLGDKEQSFVWLEKDFQAHSSTLPSWIFIPPLNELRDDPRFKDLTRRIGTQN
jgi:tetratricopeptide (TPR) repeat protein